jgi:DNA-binding response OmpR family regulator
VIDPHVILLEDDAELRALLTRGLREESFHVTTAPTAADLIRQLGDAAPDALVVDIGLPDADGRDVVQALRARGIGAPVIFLTARDTLPDRLAGFAAGGDDYLTKPFAIAELVARLRALIKRGGIDLAVETGRLRLDPASHAASYEGATVDLTPTEFRILARLSATPGDAVRRRELVQAAWPHGAIVRDNTLDVYIARLRRKLATLTEAPGIATVHGVGYSLR